MPTIVQEILTERSDTESHYEAMKKGLVQLSNIQTPTILDVTDYMNLRDTQSALECLSAFTMNHNLTSDHESVFQKLNAVHKAFRRHSKSIQIKDKNTKSAAKYLAWSYRFSRLNINRVIEFVADKGFMRKSLDQYGNTQLYVVGLHGKICDNSFSVDRNGREHRQYMSSNANHAIPVAGDISSEALQNMEELSDIYMVTETGQRKGLMRPIRMTSDDKHFIIRNFL